MTLTDEQRERYSRQILLSGLGTRGQEKLFQSSVLVIGAGGLGSAILNYLAAAGVGKIGILDNDVVENVNLHRQVLHTTKDIGRLKVESAREHLLALNPNVTVEIYPTRFTLENALEIASQYDAVIDGCDNFPTRFLANDTCFFAKRPLFFGSVIRYEGQAAVFFPGKDNEPCYRCLFPEPPSPGYVPTVAEVGVLGPVAGVIGAIQATECIKYLAGIGTDLNGRLLIYEGLGMIFRPIEVNKNSRCPLCGEQPTILSLFEYDSEGNIKTSS